MIRDPSDGTVREEINPQANKINAVAPKTASKEINLDTGLRQPTRTDAQLRLEESRKWLKEFHAKKEREHAEVNAAAKTGLRPDHAGENQQADRPRSPH